LSRFSRRSLRLAGGFDQFAAFYFAGRQIVLVTPDPGFSGLDGTDEWMAGVMKVFRGVLVFRIVAAAYVTAFEAQSEVYPGVASLNTLFTNVSARAGDSDLIQVRTGGH
jgi:hypothetical protein